jgi:uncharacterized protein DUF4234
MASSDQEHVKSVPVCVILTLVTCGLYNLYWQHLQMQSVNEMLNEDKYRFLPWLLLTLVTCGVWHIYHEYRLSEDIARVMGREKKTDGLIAVLLSVFGFSFIVDAIQQSHINAHFGDDRL